MATRLSIKQLPDSPTQGNRLQINLENKQIVARIGIAYFEEPGEKNQIACCPALKAFACDGSVPAVNGMLHRTLEELFSYLMWLPLTDMEQHLLDAGWVREPGPPVSFTRPYVEPTGELDLFRAQQSTVTERVIEAIYSFATPRTMKGLSMN